MLTGKGGKVVMRLIDADAMMDSLNNMNVSGETFTTAVEFSKKIIENAPTVGGWISVKDQLPETNDEVLTTYVYADKPGKRYVEAASYWDDGEGEGHWYSVWDEYRVGNARKTVIAWMPMPRPYKPEVSK